MRIKTLLLTLLISTSLIGTAQALTFVNSNSNNNSSNTSAEKKATTTKEKTQIERVDGLPNCTAWFASNWNNCIGKETYQNGDVYTGGFKNGVKHGQGTHTGRDGTFVGEFKYGFPFKGTMSLPDGHVHEIEFSSTGEYFEGTMTHPNGTNTYIECNKSKTEMLCSGKGTLVAPIWLIPDGTYVGEFENDKLHGYGKLTRSDGTVDEGFWENGVFVERIPANANVYGFSWKCNSGYIKSGKSCAKIPDNASASGETSWKCNSGYIKSGKNYTKKDNKCLAKKKATKSQVSYASKLPNCKYANSYWHNCFGRKNWAGGTKYVGEWKNGKYNGQGTFTDVHGTIKQGIWKDGTFSTASGTGDFTCGDTYNAGYKKFEYSCAKIPANASASSETSWKCNSGYIRSGKSCAKIPDNASASGWSNWKCNSGYIKSGKSCAKIPDNASASGETSWKCDSSYYKNGNVCLILPANAFASSDGGWECNSSYYKNDKVCIPLNSSASGDGGWKCNPGYFKSRKSCAKIPANASASSESSWYCNSGYFKSRKSCAKIPDNASASSESSWKCNSGYIRSGKSCAKIPDNASVSGETSWKCNAPFKQSGNFCITIPLNASVSGDGGWECDSGTKKIGDICKILQVKNLHFYYGTNNTDELDFSSANFCDLSPKVQLRNSIFYLPNKEEPYSGKNLCVYLKNGQYYSSGDIEKGFRQGIWSYWHHNGQKMAKGSYLDGVPVKQWNFWDENGEETRDINISESKINTANKINDMPKDTIDYRSEEYLGKLSYCLGVSSTHSPELVEIGKQIYISFFEELFPGSDIKNIVNKGFDLGKKEFAALEFGADFDEVMSNVEERARVTERCYNLSNKFREQLEGVGGYRP